MTVFIVVHSGGSYSDAYHNNLTVFLTQEEAESHIAEQNRLHDLFEPYSFNGYYDPNLSRWYDEWDKINGKYNNTASREINAKRLHQRNDWAKAKVFEAIDAGLASPDCPLTDEQRITLLTRNYTNPVENMSDCSVEEVELVVGSALWRLINGANQ